MVDDEEAARMLDRLKSKTKRRGYSEMVDKIANLRNEHVCKYCGCSWHPAMPPGELYHPNNQIQDVCGDCRRNRRK